MIFDSPWTPGWKAEGRRFDPPLTTDQLATSGPVTRPNVLHYWICSAPQVTVAARRRPPFAVRWGTRGARRMILSMRTLGGEVIGGRWGRSPVLRQLAGGVRGQRRLPYLCIERHPATNLMGNDLLADIAVVTDSSPPRCNPRLAKALWFANRLSRRRAGP